MRNYNETVLADLQNDSEYRRALLSEIRVCAAAGDVTTVKSVLKKYIDGTIGFEALGDALGWTPARLAAMLGETGMLTVDDTSRIITYLDTVESGFVTAQPMSAIAA